MIFRNRVQRYFAVTILVNASKLCFKGSYSDVRGSPHRMHSVRVRREPRLSFDGAEVQDMVCHKESDARKKVTFYENRPFYA